ncbi:hypothetical protein O0I10_007131 [Lichtheimia ornata]|uniref:C3H1-type domain-containing protein n=1 Tax=Lichtheimia ornata TaxID=688661 RepID=A0AAD7Y0D6_9FUNG|nr:uncharacterized protein O0I10_007131 [Lichtheimia ornata]KAJ8657052.1 hypothetical protein O0I10_007131 [Lichtheimia ornata]
MVNNRFTRQLTLDTTIEGQIRHRRKLSKDLFFIDVLLDNGNKDQILFRSDDGSLTREGVQDIYRSVKQGDVVRAVVGLPTDPSEYDSKSFNVWQSTAPLIVIQPYTDTKTFVADPPLGSSGPKQTIRRWDGSQKAKSEMYCKYWINQRECVRLPNCPFLHPTEEEYMAAREAWIEERMAARKITTHNPHDPHTSKKSHAQRAMVFAQWIHETFGDYLLSDQVRRGVLDIAGGKGDVSMFLSHGYNIPATVVEPETRKQPRHWYTRLRRLTCRMVRGEAPDCTVPMEEKWPYDLEPTYLATLMNDAFLENYPEVVEQAGLLIGLHSDQATEPIVDAALKMGKPFAVIPCCVFHHENRHRRLSNGNEVVTTEDFIQYLSEKDTHGQGVIEKAYLGFEGKNVVLFWRPYVTSQ